MDYMLVRMWKGEKGMEQFEVQMNSFTVTAPTAVAPATALANLKKLTKFN
ncbi:hypothetical protein P4S63_00110 [Pseudoalteromonas sp. B193]